VQQQQPPQTVPVSRVMCRRFHQQGHPQQFASFTPAPFWTMVSMVRSVPQMQDHVVKAMQTVQERVKHHERLEEESKKTATCKNNAVNSHEFTRLVSRTGGKSKKSIGCGSKTKVSVWV
jgi:hypothetical protein